MSQESKRVAQAMRWRRQQEREQLNRDRSNRPYHDHSADAFNAIAAVLGFFDKCERSAKEEDRKDGQS